MTRDCPVDPNCTEYVVLASEDGQPIGTECKLTVHTADTPLHFAFSVFLLRADGKLLLTRRALTKLTWPGVWTNSFCGHPGPDEATAQAILRRAADELGIPAEAITELREILPDFRYQAVDSSGVMENELCPVYVARLADGFAVEPVPAQVDSFLWEEPVKVFEAIDALPGTFSPWMVEELSHPELREVLVAGVDAVKE